MKIGPYTYSHPVMEHNGFDINFTMEEDENGTISYLIYYLQEKIIGGKGSNGNYRPQSENRVSSITINTYDDYGDPIMTVIFKDAFFVSSDKLSLDYEGSDSIKYGISFHCDLMDIIYHKVPEANISNVMTNVSTSNSNINSNIA